MSAIALVVFCDNTEHWASFLLKPGFRHVFVCVLVWTQGVGYWLCIDPSSGVPEFSVLCGTGGDPRGHFESLGATVVEVRREDASPPRWPWAVSNCVGVVKVVLGIRAPFVITPYQLYRRLMRCSR